MSLKFSAPEVEFSTPEAEVKIGNSEYAAEYSQVLFLTFIFLW
jgi:hypothetical protein